MSHDPVFLWSVKIVCKERPGARILANARHLNLGRQIPADWFLEKEHT